jgi:hypothetical protein
MPSERGGSFVYEIIEGFHKALGIESTWVFVLIMALIGFLSFGLLGWVVDLGYRNSPEYKLARGRQLGTETASTDTPASTSGGGPVGGHASDAEIEKAKETGRKAVSQPATLSDKRKQTLGQGSTIPQSDPTKVAPASPAPIPQPQSSARGPSAYQELQDAMEAVDRLSGDKWKATIVDALSVKTRSLAGDGGPPQTADASFRDRMIRLDQDVQRDWPTLEQQVRKAHSDAINRMSQPGSLQLTRNQIEADKEQFNKSLESPRQKAFDPENPDMDRFSPLLTYLRGLLKQLGDYPEVP